MSRLIVQKVPTVEDRSLPIFDEFNEVAERIRIRAYSLSKRRGFSEGHDLDDWLAAEREICWPSAELVEEDDFFEVKVALAGFDVEDISVTATPNELIIKAARSVDEQDSSDTEGARVRWSELSNDDVYRHIELPSNIDVDNVTAKFRSGMLEIEAPKADLEEQAHTDIEITTDE
jgi:HSP20 family protein